MYRNTLLLADTGVFIVEYLHVKQPNEKNEYYDGEDAEDDETLAGTGVIHVSLRG